MVTRFGMSEKVACHHFVNTDRGQRNVLELAVSDERQSSSAEKEGSSGLMIGPAIENSMRKAVHLTV